MQHLLIVFSGIVGVQSPKVCIFLKCLCWYRIKKKKFARFWMYRLFVGVSDFVLIGKDALQSVFLNFCYSTIGSACSLCRVWIHLSRWDQRMILPRQNCSQTQWKGRSIKSDFSIYLDVFNQSFVTDSEGCVDYDVDKSRYSQSFILI